MIFSLSSLQQCITLLHPSIHSSLVYVPMNEKLFDYVIGWHVFVFCVSQRRILLFSTLMGTLNLCINPFPRCTTQFGCESLCIALHYIYFLYGWSLIRMGNATTMKLMLIVVGMEEQPSVQVCCLLPHPLSISVLIGQNVCYFSLARMMSIWFRESWKNSFLAAVILLLPHSLLLPCTMLC